jgi:putative ATPase
MNDIFPLADFLRPNSLDTFVGQEHLVGQNKMIRSFIENKKLNSMIFWGPPGTGKTTLSRIIVKQMDLPSTEFSATISKLDDIRTVMKRAAEIKQMTGNPLVLFVDEIHHFNRSAQDAFLPYVERGDIILLGTTTKTPRSRSIAPSSLASKYWNSSPSKPNNSNKSSKMEWISLKKKPT